MSRSKVLCEIFKDQLIIGPNELSLHDIIRQRLRGLDFYTKKYREDDTYYVIVSRNDAYSALVRLTKDYDLYIY